MSLSREEQEIVLYGQQSGKSREEIAKAIGQFRYEQKLQTSATPEQKPGLLQNVAAGLAEGFSGAGRTIQSILPKNLATVPEPGGRKTANERGRDARLEGMGADPNALSTKVGEVGGEMVSMTGPGGLAKSPLTLGKKLLGYGAFGAGTGYIYDIGQKIAEGNDLEDSLVPGANTLLGGTLGPLGAPARRGGKALTEGAQAVAKAAVEAGKVVTDSPVVRGAFQIGTEFAERAPRFISKRRADIRDAATKAERIENSPAPIGNALKAGVDERIINTIEQADEPTRKGYSEIVRLAEESIDTSGTLKTSARPEIVAGEAAAEQYKLIDQQKRKIGQAIGDVVETLSRDVQVPMKGAYNELDDSLRALDISIDYDEAGVVLDFSKAGFSDAQEAKIRELYKQATKGGDTLTPKQIHAKDRVFSQLSREARFDKIGDILIDVVDETGDTKKLSLFQIFRDVYSDTLEEVAPDIKPLNKQYRNLITFLDDIESSIIKSGKFETNSRLDPAEFAQTNLRRLFSEAQSASDYRAIADEMDSAARALGYQGAMPADLAQFAYEIRKIYPESTPRTGFEGSIKASIGGMADAVMKAGKPDVTDQQKALRELIDSMMQQ